MAVEILETRGEKNFHYIFNQVEEKAIKSKEGPKKYSKLISGKSGKMNLKLLVTRTILFGKGNSDHLISKSIQDA